MFGLFFRKLAFRSSSFLSSPSHAFRFYSSDFSRVLVDWENTNKFQYQNQVLFKKQPDRVAEPVPHSLEYNFLKSTNFYLDSIFHYSVKISNLYSSLLANHKLQELMDHFETQVLVLDYFILKLYLKAALQTKQYKKVVSTYEKYIHLFGRKYNKHAVLAYIALRNEAKALEIFKSNVDLVTASDLDSFLGYTKLPNVLIEYILDEPKLESRLPLAQLERAVQYGHYTQFKDKLKQKIETISKKGSIYVYTEIFENFKSKLEEFKQNPSNFDETELLGLIKQLLFHTDNFFELLPSYLYVAQQQLLPEQFFELLVKCVLFLNNKNHFKAIAILSNYTLPIEFQISFFIKYINRSTDVPDNLVLKMESIRPWFEKSQILKVFLDDPVDDQLRDVIMKYFLILKDYDNAKRIIDASWETTVHSKPFSLVLKYLYLNRMAEQYVFLFQNVTLRLLVNPTVYIKDLTISYYIKFLSILGHNKEVKSFYYYCKSMNVELSPISLLLVMKHVVNTDKTLFAKLFEEFISHPNTNFVVNAKNLSYIILYLRDDQKWVQKIKEQILDKYELDENLLPGAQEIISNAPSKTLQHKHSSSKKN